MFRSCNSHILIAHHLRLRRGYLSLKRETSHEQTVHWICDHSDTPILCWQEQCLWKRQLQRLMGQCFSIKYSTQETIFCICDTMQYRGHTYSGHSLHRIPIQFCQEQFKRLLFQNQESFTELSYNVWTKIQGFFLRVEYHLLIPYHFFERGLKLYCQNTEMERCKFKLCMIGRYLCKKSSWWYKIIKDGDCWAGDESSG